MTRVFVIGFPGEGGQSHFAEGEYADAGGFLVRGPVCTTEAAATKHLAHAFLASEADAVISVDVVGGGGVGTVVFEPIHTEEDGGETWGLFGTRAAAIAFMAAKKKAADGDCGGDGEYTVWQIREHVVRGS